MNRHSRFLLCLAVVSALLAPAAFGQSATSGAFSGTVSDQDGTTALPGAAITAVHDATGTRYSAVSGNDGRFRIANVKPGLYSVTATVAGFREQAADVSVSLGDTTTLTFRLQLESIEETVYVVGESTPLINPSKTGSSSNIYTEALESLPTVRRSIEEFARTNPLFTVHGENDEPATLSAGGRNSQYNNISIDGSVNNDLFGLSDGGTPGGQSGTTPISIDAIQEVQLVIASFDVRQGGFTGGSVNAITRSGSNDIKGSLFYFTRDSDFFGDGPEELGGELRGFEEDQYGFRLGGPISKDKAFFFANVDIEDRQAPLGWSIDGSSGSAWADGELVDEVNLYRDTLISRYGFDPGPNTEQIQDDPSDKYFARLDFNLSDKHNLTLRHNYVDAAKDINRPGSFTFEMESETYTFQTETNSTVAQLNSAVSGSMFNELRLALQTIEDRRAGIDGVRFPWMEIEDVNGPGSGRNELEAGTEPFSTRNSLDQDIFEIHDDFTWLRGNHTITIGTHNELFTFDNLFIQNAFGSYEFSNLAAFIAGDVRRFRYAVVAPGQPASQKFDVNQLGLYVGDEWAAKDNLTLTYGIRVDVPFFPDKPTRNPFTEATYGIRTDNIPDGEQLWQPRLGFNWDIGGDGRSQLRGGAGIFAGRAPYVWISNNYGRTGLEQIFVTCSGSSAPEFNPDPDSQSPLCGLAGGDTGEFNLIDPNFKLPTVLRFNLGYDRELPWWGMIGSIELVLTDSQEEIDYQNVNITPSGTTFDGRPSYSRVDTSVSGAYYITNTSDGESTQLAVKLERPFRNGIWGYVSYAWTDSEVVNEGTSSRAVSNFNFQETLDPNNATASRSEFEVEHRFNASLSYRFNRDSRAPTTLALFYNLQSGRPFSWIMGSDFVRFGFGQSVNGDGSDGNDLLYVPSGPDDVSFTNGSWPELDAFISSHPVLDQNRGRVVPRAAGTAPWNHSLDLHIDQEIPIKNTSLQITFDILNVMNIFDDDAGVLHYANFNAVDIGELEGIDAAGRPIYNLFNTVTDPENNSIYRTHPTNSRWRAKLGIRWSF